MNDNKKPARRPRIEEQKPVAVTQAMRVFAETGSIENAAEVAGCHVRTIRRLIERDSGFCQVKKALAERAFVLSAAAQEVALERVGELSGMQAAVAAKLSAQSGLELSQQQSAAQFTLSDLAEAMNALDELLALPKVSVSQQGTALEATESSTGGGQLAHGEFQAGEN